MNAYAEYSEYVSIYGDKVTEQQFERLCFDSVSIVNDITTGVDGICKLRIAFPSDEYDAEIVRRCVYALINLKAHTEELSGYTTREDGSVVPKRVTSMSSGAESIHYADVSSDASNSAGYPINRVQLAAAARGMLTGANDANGVSLLYMGRYPHVR